MGSFRIATLRGIPVKVHFTLLLVLPLLAVAFSQSLTSAARLAEVPPSQLGGSPLLWGVGFAVALFLSVLLHELAQSLYALRTGGKVKDITDAIVQLDAAKLRKLPVVAHGALVGVVTREGILRGIQRRELRASPPVPRWRWGGAAPSSE